MKYSKKYIFPILILFIQTSVVAQSDLIKKANQLFEAEVYTEAAEIYTAFLQNSFDISHAINLAICLQLLNKPIDAEFWYAEILKQNPNDSTILLQYANLLKYNGKYVSAKEMYLKYADYNADGYYLAGSCDFALNEKQNKSILIDTVSFNTISSEIAPAFFGSGILFASNMQIDPENKSYVSKSVQQFYDIYYVENLSDPKPHPFHKNVNSTLHEASATYDPSKNILYFTRSNYLKGREIRSKEKKVQIEIYTATFNGGKWSPLKSISINNKNYSSGQPCLSSDGKILLFTSDMPGGFGGTDIYFSAWENNAWSVPINAGPTINSKGNETYPFLSESGTFYFSSDWLIGFGGFDIFSSTRINGHWSKPENLGTPINSSRDDFGFIIKQGSGFFSSNRIGSKGFDDIYSVRMLQTITGFFVTDAQQVPLAFVNIKMQENNHLINVGQTDENGMIQIKMEDKKNYTAILQKSGFKELIITNLDEINSSNGLYPIQMQSLMGANEQISGQEKETIITEPQVKVSVEKNEVAFTYELQIGVFENPDYSKISSLTSYGELSVKSKENGFLSFSIISLNSKEKAEEAKASAIQLGFTDAYLIQYKNGIKQE